MTRKRWIRSVAWAQYTNLSEQVLIWLGEATTNITPAFEFADQFSRRYGFTDDTSPPLMSAFYGFGDRNITYVLPPDITAEGDLICKMAISSHLGDILGRPWFARVWIVQELLLAKSAILMCGGVNVKWEEFSYMMIILHEVMDKTVANKPLKEDLKSAWNIVQFQEQHKFGKMFFSITMMLLAPISFLAFMNKQKCKEEKDRVFGILGLGDQHFGHIGVDPSLFKMSISAEEPLDLATIKVASALNLSERLESAANEERELSTAESSASEIVTYGSMKDEVLLRLARTLLADSVALVPELDILDLPEEPPRMSQEDLQSLWASFEKHFLAENGELRLRYEKLSKLPLSRLVQGESILVGTTEPVMDAELNQNLSNGAMKAWKVYVAFEQTATYQLVGPAYVEGLMDGEGLTYTEIGDGQVRFPTAIVV
ncbi:hypothetical protein IFR05_013288 [Cadophora sp. M221]|nr:hypothetical protein IFR05_013288 [Cadophora sp. M221]